MDEMRRATLWLHLSSAGQPAVQAIAETFPTRARDSQQTRDSALRAMWPRSRAQCDDHCGAMGPPYAASSLRVVWFGGLCTADSTQLLHNMVSCFLSRAHQNDSHAIAETDNPAGCAFILARTTGSE